MKIMPNRLDRGFYMYQKEFEDKALEVLRSGWYVLGNEVKSFEEEWAAYTGAKYCVGLASGLDALWMAFRILGIGAGDEVIVQGNTYIASVMGITKMCIRDRLCAMRALTRRWTTWRWSAA